MVDTKPTALENLVSKLLSDDYNMIREAIDTLQEGVFAIYQALSNQLLSKANVDALLQDGPTDHTGFGGKCVS